MKRLLTIGLMLAAALALTNCVDQFETPVQENDIIVDETTTLQGEGEPFEVFVETAETKLNYDGNNYYWYDGKDKDGNIEKDENGNPKTPDQISLYSIVKHSNNTQSLQYHSDFKYIGGGKFVGKLASALQDVNDWYSIFPCSSSAPTVTIGATSTQKQLSANNKRHLVGPGYPMYGVKKNVPKNKSPKFSMSHLSAIIALEIVNNGAGGNIVIKDAQIEATEEIVGDFTVDLLGASAPTFTKGSNVSKIARIELTNAANVTYGNSATLYLAVKPFDASEKDLKISVNGSTRTVTMPANTVFRTGTLTKIRVPVTELKASQITDVLAKDGQRPFTSRADRDDNTTYDILTITGTKIDGGLIINGKQVNDVYQIGTADGGIGKIVIKGYAKDMINALPISFNVSSMDNEPAAMTISSINASIPQYREHYDKMTTLWGSTEYDTGIGTVYAKDYTKNKIWRKQLGKHGILGTTLGTGAKAILKGMSVSLGDGMDRGEIVKFASGNTITFNNIPTNGYFKNGNVVVLDETNTNKSINTGVIDYFLGEKFSTSTHTATYKGLYAILNAQYVQDEVTGTWGFKYEGYTEVVNGIENKYSDVQMGAYAIETATAMLGRIKASLEARGIGSLYSVIVDSEVDLMHMLRETLITIELSNYPYKDIYPEEENLTSGYKPLIVWGLDATLPSERVQ